MGAKYDTELGVHSGETKELDKVYENFQNMYQLDNASEKFMTDIGKLWDETLAHWEKDDVKGSGDARPFFDSMKNIRQVPASAFIIAFLADKVGFPRDKGDLRRLNAFIEEFAVKHVVATEASKRREFRKILTNPGTAPGLSATEEQLLSGLAERVRAVMILFPEMSEKTDDAHWSEYFRGLLFNLNFSNMRDIAFTFNMDSDQFEIFLLKALRRSWINFFNREEILTYIVLQYRESAKDVADCFLIYKDLCQKYPVRKNGGVHPNAFKKVKSEEAGTKMVQEKVKGMLDELDWAGKDVFEYSEELHEILDWVYDRSEKNRLTRSAKKVFEEELKVLFEKLSVEIAEVDTDRTENDNPDKSMGQECKPFTMEYLAKEDCVLKKGFQMFGDTNIKEDGWAAIAAYETTEDVHLFAERRRCLNIQVDPITILRPGEEAPAKIVKSKHVEGLFRVDSTPSCSKRYEVAEKYNDAEKLKLEVHPGGAMHFTADEKAKKGTLEIICAPGTTIYEGTVFSFECMGRSYQYRVRESETAPIASVAQIPVSLINAEELWKLKSSRMDKYEKKVCVVDTGSDIDLRDELCPPGLQILSISNTKRVSVEDPSSLEGQKRKTGKKNYYRLFRYLYGKNEYKGVTSYGPSYFLNTAKFKAAMLSYNSVSAFPKSEVKARDLLITLSFLNFASDDLSLYKYDTGIPRAQGLIEDFTTRCNEVLDRCGFMHLYSGNPYDEFLRRLLTSQDPMNLYMSIFSDEHFMTQYILVDTEESNGDWCWKVVRMLPDGSRETWCEGREKKGAKLITMPRLVTKNGSKYEIEITFADPGKTVRKKIKLDPRQEFTVKTGPIG